MGKYNVVLDQKGHQQFPLLCLLQRQHIVIKPLVVLIPQPCICLCILRAGEVSRIGVAIRRLQARTPAGTLKLTRPLLTRWRWKN